MLKGQEKGGEEGTHADTERVQSRDRERGKKTGS